MMLDPLKTTNPKHSPEIELLESEVLDLADKLGVRLQPSTSIGSSLTETLWGVQVSLEYKGHPVEIALHRAELVGNEAEQLYEIHINVLSDEYCDFHDLGVASFDGMYAALEAYEDYIGYALDDFIPDHLVTKQMKWYEHQMTLPASLREEGMSALPVTQIIKRFTLQNNFEHVEVKMGFDGVNETIYLNYSDRGYSEQVVISDRSIKGVLRKRKEVTRPTRQQLLSGDPDELDLVRAYFSGPAELSPYTYHNLKRYEQLLRSLPMQEQLEPFYRGSGIFAPPKLHNATFGKYRGLARYKLSRDRSGS